MLIDKLKIVFNYIGFWWHSGNEHGLHSPFVYKLYTEAVRSKNKYYAFDEIELLRNNMLNSEAEIVVNDFGAGSKVNKSAARKISDIARNAQKSPELAQIIFRIVAQLQPKVTLDLGTSLGLTTLYLSKAYTKSKVYTFEGCEATSGVAKQNFKALNANNIEQITGNIDNTLPQFLAKSDKLDFVFFDANHRYEPTIRYFEMCLEKAHEETIFIFDDIYWSSEMKKAWQEIKNHHEVTVSVDLFYFGLISFRKKQPRQHFMLRI